LIESVIVEMCVSVIEVPPIRDAVTAVNKPAVCRALMKDVRPMTNSRYPLTVDTRSSAERLSIFSDAGFLPSVVSLLSMQSLAVMMGLEVIIGGQSPAQYGSVNLLRYWGRNAANLKGCRTRV